MGFRLTRGNLTVGVVLLLGGVALCSCGRRVETYRDVNVVAGEIRSLFQGILPHTSAVQFLTVKGKTYKGVRGAAPFYLPIPQLHSILFATEGPGPGYRTAIHVVDLQTNRYLRFDANTGFGGSIGSGRKPGEKGTDYIEAVDPPRVIIAQRSVLDWKARIVLNVESGTVERHDYWEYDSGGRVTKHYVNGQLMR